MNKKYTTSHISNSELHRIWFALHTLLESKKIYLQKPNLKALSKTLDTNPKYLSQTVNQATSNNLITLFHTYRIEHFLEKINNGEAKIKTFEALIQESGFNNRTSFYKSFKKIIGCKPTDLMP